MAKTSQHHDIDPLEVSLGRPITADLLKRISQLVNFAGRSGEQHISCALGSDGWTYGNDSAGSGAGAASSEGPLPHAVSTDAETTVLDTDVFVAYAGTLTGEVYIHDTGASTVAIRIYAASTYTSSLLTTNTWQNVGPVNVSAGWNRVRVTVQRTSGSGTIEVQSIGLRDGTETIGDPSDA